MQYLRKHGLDLLIRDLQQPVFAICLGLQLLCSFSEESNTECIGIFDETVKKFELKDKVPHMGWNTITRAGGHILSGDMSGQYVYFVHSYYAPVCNFTAAVTDYIQPFSSALEKNNFFATQFHPEKSGSVGENILKRFLEL